MHKLETTISGIAFKSTVEQMSLIGSIGKEILQEYKITKVDLNKKYSSKLRGAIHDSVRKRFGNEALFLFGITVVDAYTEIGIKREKSVHEYLYQNSARLDSSNISIAREARNDFVKVYGDYVDASTKQVVFTPENNVVGASVRILSIDKIEFKLTNAILLQNEYFNRGVIVDALAPLMKNWEIQIKFLKSRSKVGKTGWTKFIWHIYFKRKITNKLASQIVLEQRQKAKDKFIKNVLKDSNDQKKQAQLLTNQLSKFIPPQIHEAMMKGNYNTDIITKRKKLTVFFSDIKNFTQISENLQPEDLTRYLNEYFSQMTQIALDHGATIDKYIGDALMLFFGDPVSNGEKEDARNCIEMALMMQVKMTELQNKWKNEGFLDPFQIRIGINTGYCNVGNFGSEQRLTYTIIGEEVNVASRLESACDANGILISYETYAHAQDMVEVKEKKSVEMKGIHRKVKVFKITGRKENKIIQKENNQLDIDHIVLTVNNLDKTISFYCNELGMTVEEFTTESSSEIRKCLKFGKQKINLHPSDNPIKPGAKTPLSGTADICFISSKPIKDWQKQFKKNSIKVVYGPVIQIGATSPLYSIYIRDPDHNLIEISNKVV